MIWEEERCCCPAEHPPTSLYASVRQRGQHPPRDPPHASEHSGQTKPHTVIWASQADWTSNSPETGPLPPGERL